MFPYVIQINQNRTKPQHRHSKLPAIPTVIKLPNWTTTATLHCALQLLAFQIVTPNYPETFYEIEEEEKKRRKNHHSDTTGSRGEGIHTNWQISKRKHPHCSWIAWPNSYISLLGGKRRVRFDVCNQWERIHYHPCCCQRQVKKTQIACMQINVRNSGVSQCNLQFPVKGSERASISNRRTKS